MLILNEFQAIGLECRQRRRIRSNLIEKGGKRRGSAPDDKKSIESEAAGRRQSKSRSIFQGKLGIRKGNRTSVTNGEPSVNVPANDISVSATEVRTNERTGDRLGEILPTNG